MSCPATHILVALIRSHPAACRHPHREAILAVAASILTAAYYMLRDGTTYQDLGADHFERRDKTRIANRLIRRLEDLGLSVEVKPAASGPFLSRTPSGHGRSGPITDDQEHH